MPRYVLELLAVDEDQVAGALVGAGEQRAEHDGVGTGDERLRDVARVLQAAVGDHRDAGLARGERRLVDGGDLRHADAGDDAGGADRAGADADLDGVRARVDERLRAGAGGDVAADDVDVVERRVGLEPADDVDHARGVAVGGVDDDDVDAGVAQSTPARSQASPKKPMARADAQAALVILGRVRVLLALVEVLDGDEAGEAAVRVDERQLLDLVLREDRDRAIRVDADRAR